MVVVTRLVVEFNENGRHKKYLTVAVDNDERNGRIFGDYE
jgi:hypothetical protein